MRQVAAGNSPLPDSIALFADEPERIPGGDRARTPRYSVSRDTASLQVSGGWGAPNQFPGLAPGKRVYGPLRLLDVKPPCSNLAEALCFGQFLCARRGYEGRRNSRASAGTGSSGNWLSRCRAMASLISNDHR